MEPFEELMCEVEDEHTGAVIEAVSLRKGEVGRALLSGSWSDVGIQLVCCAVVMAARFVATRPSAVAQLGTVIRSML